MGLYSFKAIWVEGWSTIPFRSIPRQNASLLSADTELKTMQPSGCSTLFHFLYHFLQMSAVSTDEDGIGAGKGSEVGVQEISGYRRNARRAEAAGVGVHQLVFLRGRISKEMTAR